MLNFINGKMQIEITRYNQTSTYMANLKKKKTENNWQEHGATGTLTCCCCK